MWSAKLSTFTLPGSFEQSVALSSWTLFCHFSTGQQHPSWQDFRRWDRRAWKWPIWVFAQLQGWVSNARLPIPGSSLRPHQVDEGWRYKPCHPRRHLGATYPKWRSWLAAYLGNLGGKPIEPWRNLPRKEFRRVPWSKFPIRIDCYHRPSPRTPSRWDFCTNLYFGSSSQRWEIMVVRNLVGLIVTLAMNNGNWHAMMNPTNANQSPVAMRPKLLEVIPYRSPKILEESSRPTIILFHIYLPANWRRSNSVPYSDIFKI